MVDRPIVYFLCTGNAARSVMAGVMMRTLTEAVDVRGAGTHVIEGQPMSLRTRTALERHGLRDPHHRSHQLTASDVERADLICAMEPLNVAWVRRTHPSGASRTATLKRLARFLAPAAPGGPGLAERVASLGLAEVELEPWEEIVDPGSGSQADFDRTADELAELVTILGRVLG
ncbi:MAG: hypothetical protein ACE5GB_03005 [Acidimicrobiales bacterium]